MRNHNKSYRDNKKMATISHNVVRTFLTYDPEAGTLIWNVVRGSTIRPGDSAQFPQMSLNGVRIATTHVIWFWMTGTWPKGIIDHRDRNKLNHTWDNLRDTSHQVKSVHERMKSTGECIKELSSGQYAVNIDTGSQMMVVGVYGKYETAVKVYDACTYLRDAMK